MRTAVLLSSLAAVLPALAATSQDGVSKKLSRRQFDISSILQGLGGLGKGIGGMLGNVNAAPAKTENLPPIMRVGAKREKMWFGPFTLPAVNTPHLTGMPLQMDPSGVQVIRRLTGFCSNCTVLFSKANLVFENGTRATPEHGVYEHHIVVVDVTKRSFPFYLCDGQSGFLGTFPAVGFIVSGHDEAANYFTTPDARFNSGYLINKNPLLAMQSELVNYRTEPQTVYIAMEYEYLPGQSSGPADSTVSLFSVTGCKFPDYHPTERIYNMTSALVNVPMDGYIINAKGHLHDGGDHIVLKLNDKVICDSKAIYGKDNRDALGGPQAGKTAQQQSGAQKDWESIVEMTQCTSPVRVRKGDKISMTSFYDGVKHPPRPTMNHEGKHLEADEMGVFFINFAASSKPAEQLEVKGNQLVQSASGRPLV